MPDLTAPPAQEDAPPGASSVLSTRLCQRFQASHAEPVETLQELWSGYGRISRYRLYYADTGPSDADFTAMSDSDIDQPLTPSTVIVKSIRPGEHSQHPRGWDTSTSHQRKLQSYEVETHFYQHWGSRCDTHCPIAQCYDVIQDTHTTHIVLEDLDAAGFHHRAERLTPGQAKTCLHWLAQFHNQFLQKDPAKDWPQKLWPTGTYWHLATRSDEWNGMAESPLKRHASAIDQALNQCRHQTLVHGDAKVANFCFAPDFSRVAAVDFQYVGGGCGMKDVVYFLGSCLSEADCEHYSATLLDDYFASLTEAFSRRPSSNICLNELEQEWRSLFPLAWADFQRFLLGWSPSHRKINHFSQKMTALALERLSVSRR